MKCSSCGQEVTVADAYVHAGKTLCEDCYLDAVHKVKACDPWAVYAAKRQRESQQQCGAEGLTERQRVIYQFIKDRGKATREEIMASLGLKQTEMETELAVLRHCELVRGCRENGKIYVVPF